LFFVWLAKVTSYEKVRGQKMHLNQNFILTSIKPPLVK